MKKQILLVSCILINSAIYCQTVEEIRHENNSKIKKLKKEYYNNLQQNQDARIFSITDQRNENTTTKLNQKRHEAKLNHKNNNASRMQVNIKQQQDLNTQNSRYTDSITNALGYRRVNKAIAKRKKQQQLEELRASNKRELFYRSQAISQKKNNQEDILKTKINTRHHILKKKYTIKNSD